ncbi:hypothetical protein Salmuc_05501 [Salipiger mucosus DSM 16094]|uniref:Uncharacterized protein n=1 Tax=Salipiger mucosus DSM 16094 TaxID=1123237 RepID=S9QDR4_9RHOB|nr:hypothetical protein Salmuc_05501 [Salipiger mucosus DSM 16094]
MHRDLRGRNALTEGDPGHTPWDRKSRHTSGVGVPLECAGRAVKPRGRRHLRRGDAER